jgi:hypothetical protein
MSVRESEGWLLELRGSRPWTEAEGRRVLEAWSASGETVPSFARRVGLGAGRLYWWRERLGGAGTRAGARGVEPVSAPAPSFLPVVVRAASAIQLGTGAPVTVCTRGGLRVEVAALDAVSASWVATLVRSLEEAPS